MYGAAAMGRPGGEGRAQAPPPPPAGVYFFFFFVGITFTVSTCEP
jgi:hypothetical protein